MHTRITQAVTFPVIPGTEDNSWSLLDCTYEKLGVTAWVDSHGAGVILHFILEFFSWNGHQACFCDFSRNSEAYTL